MSGSSHARSHHSHSDGTSKIANLSDELSGMKETISEGVQDVTDRGRRIFDAAGQSARHAVESARDSALERRDRVGKAIAARPYTSVAIAAAAGAAGLGLLMLLRRR